MKTFAASTSIRARPETIWALLTNADGYPEWNSTIDKVAGRIAAGETITVHARAAGRAFPVKVAEFEPPRAMVWSGGLPLGLFAGRRQFTLNPRDDGTVDVSMREEFTGWLAPLLTRSIPDLQPSFDAFVADLKRRAEATA